MGVGEGVGRGVSEGKGVADGAGVKFITGAAYAAATIEFNHQYPPMNRQQIHRKSIPSDPNWGTVIPK